MTRYPNLELLEYKAKQLLSQDKEFLSAVEQYKKENNTKYAAFDFDTTMFPQVWGSTCTGFDVAADGSPAISGCAMTKEYTTILCETLTGSYIVCFGDRPCYKVTNPSEDFLNDMKQHRMASLSEAKGRY
jgi:hypothetical protein